jgi:hypothetical protein
MSADHDERDANGSFDMSGRDQVTLSAKERQSLAHLEERVRHDDPDFASRMRGRSWRLLRHVMKSVRLPTMATWVGPVLFGLGLVATLLVVDSVVWLSVVTLAVTTLGAYGIGCSVRARMERSSDPPG